VLYARNLFQEKMKEFTCGAAFTCGVTYKLLVAFSWLKVKAGADCSKPSKGIFY